MKKEPLNWNLDDNQADTTKIRNNQGERAMLLKGPAQQLADIMIKLSIKYYSKEWEFGLEFELWNEISGNQDLLTDSEISKLKEISKWCNGWITMFYAGGKENLDFMLLEDWKKKYQKDKPF